MWPRYCLQHLLQGHRWRWPSSPLLRLVGDVVCDDVSLTARAICQRTTACFQLPFPSHKCGSRRAGVGRGKSGRRVKDGYSYGAREKVRAGRLLRQQHQWNPGAATAVKPRILNKALSDCRRRLSVQTPKPLPPFSLPRTHSRLALTHCVSSSNTLHSLLP